MHSWYSTWWFLLPLAGIYTHIIITLLFAPSSSIHWIFSEPSGKVLTRWSMIFFHKIATPPYPLGNDTGRSVSFISTPFATKLMSLLMSEITLVYEWKSQCSCIKIMSLSFRPPLHPGQTTRIVPREKQSGNRYTPLNPRTATSVPFLVNSNPLRMNRHQY
jgi:hypothetical protein